MSLHSMRRPASSTTNKNQQSITNKHHLSGHPGPRRSTQANTCSSLSHLGFLRRGLLSLFLRPGLLLSQRAGGGAWALAYRKRSTLFRLLRRRRRRRRRRWRAALARRRAVLPLRLRLRLPLRWVLARQLFAAPDFHLGQVVHELLDVVCLVGLADCAQ
jgi:hypothetical protein